MLDLITDIELTSVKGFLLHLLCAAALGFVIGLERQWTHHQAGILTNLIVCLGSFAFASFGYLLADDSVDLTRIAAQVVSGVGFLGAGVILRDGGNVKGLNTAATVWASAAVGILCCLTNLVYAILVGIAIVLLHLLLHPVSSKIDKIKKYDKRDTKKNRKAEALYKISVVCPEGYEPGIRKSIIDMIKAEPEALLHTLESSASHTEEHNKKIRAYITTKTDNDALIESLITKVGKNEEIISAGWKIEHE